MELGGDGKGRTETGYDGKGREWAQRKREEKKEMKTPWIRNGKKYT